MDTLIAWSARVGAFAIGALMTSLAWAEGYSKHPQASTLIDEMVEEHKFERAALETLFRQAEKKQSILDAIARPAEKTKPWKEYRSIFLTTSRTRKGVEFWRNNRETLARAEQAYGVAQEIIVAILGVETRYGQQTGGYRVIDALSTLAFDYPPRAPFFRKELKQFLLLSREQKQNPLDLKGSYAGAMGYGQFMPSSYRHYAVDFDGDDFIDIWNNQADAIGSVANYFKEHGWQPGQAVVSRARINGDYKRDIVNRSLKPEHTIAELKAFGFTAVEEYPADSPATAIKLEGEHGAEFWIGLTNFYAITRYNHSHLYAMAVYQLGQSIKRQMTKEYPDSSEGA